ncbi:MAG: hypothetical protein NT072_12450 [Deltaproteobacteria bacterium]|nr:hypothetical protein [Deltaproteobacteria bacterium]
MPFLNFINRNSAFACGDCGEGCVAATPFVTLVTFTATLSPDESKILIEWETSKEVRALEFNILRSKREGGDSVRINEEMIRPEGGDTWGAAYIYEDSDIKPDDSYLYYLESKDECGAKYIFGPIRYGGCDDCEGNPCFITIIRNSP